MSGGNEGALPLSGVNVLVGASGSVATVRVPRLIDRLRASGATIRLVLTAHARHFLEADEELTAGICKVYTDADEWAQWNRLSDPVLHIELRKWAHVFLIAPTSANTLAKLANGLCDDLLTCIARAWPFASDDEKPLIIAPAMNTAMWDHAITRVHLNAVSSFGIHVIPPISKKLACGDSGIGAMENVDIIVDCLIRHVHIQSRKSVKQPSTS